MLNLVIVDDEAIVRHGIRLSVPWKELSFSRVEEASSGKEVIDRLDDWQPDLIITDMIMPDINGMELIRQVKARKSSCKFIVLSCTNDFAYVKEALLLGASDYLLKMTIRPDDLTECVSRIAKQMIEEKKPKSGRQSVLTEDHYKVGSFFRDILTYKHAAAQIKEMSSLYRLRSTLSRFSVTVMQVNLKEALFRFGEDGSYLISFSLINLIEDFIKKYEDLDFFTVEHDEYVFIMDSRPQESLCDYENRLTRRWIELAGHIQKYLKLDVRFGISGLCHLERLLTAYHNAKKAAELNMFRKESSTVHSRELPDYPEDSSDSLVQPNAGKDCDLIALFDSRFRQRITHALTYGKEEEALETIEEYFALLQEDRCSIRTAEICIDKAAALMRVCAMELNSYPSAKDVGPVEEWGARGFNLHWSIDRTKDSLKQYCSYLLDRKRRLMDTGRRRVIVEIQSYLSVNYANKITLEQTAKHFHMNKNYLSQLFKLETGINFTRYLNGIRVDRAKQLIMQTSDTVSEISDKIGFSDFRYFSRVFKQHTGLSPMEFKHSMNDKGQDRESHSKVRDSQFI
ncbi:response regulator [Paenibacillus sp. J2TS4]|uniref:response regulator transcription factor n=1 Tax=Paenibacillus sp. J2TS4 TaxID=2807194 RepID=UPI001B1B95CB|nr:response regulator [Paenibacillus sp. J2TS4]GIP34616.1 hypothetical protein J2TS4_38260 [Paenibacillus sp. J2TS4]